MFVNPQMGLLFSIAFYILFRRSSSTDNIESSESRKAETMAKVNGDSHIDLKFPKNSKGEIMETRDNSDILEVEVVKKMAPSNERPSFFDDASYEPVQSSSVIEATSL